MSGHSRLKQALLLRDALAGSIGLPLERTITACAAVEDEFGALRALEEDRYRDALRALATCEESLLDALDSAVKDACAAAGFVPRYAQYLALLLFARWAELRFIDESALLALLDEALAAFHEKQTKRSEKQRETIDAFTPADLQMAAFWMATAAGKTHVLHACLAMLGPRARWDRIFIITPTEALSRQHARRLRALAPPAKAQRVFVYPDDGDAAALGHLPADTVVVMDINKLGEKASGDGATLPTSRFMDSCNLVFVDEGHKGQKSEASLWKKLQRHLAGIGASQPKHRGLLIEFSATFGQVAEAEHAFASYAKSIVFDYAYDRFHADRYGKDFLHTRLDAQAEAAIAATDTTLAAALLAYWWQRHAWLDPEVTRERAALQLDIADPLWLLLGLHVIGGKGSAEDMAQTADVVAVLAWLDRLLRDRVLLVTAIARIKALGGAIAELLPSALVTRIGGTSNEALATHVLAEVFGWQVGDKPLLRTLSAAKGELGLGLLRGAQTRYYGVVNVGDVAGLKRAAEEHGLEVEPDALTASLFAGLDKSGSGINLLIGSRRFAEGWDNYRASSMTLLRLGQKEGSLIVQMFGRVIRFAGVHGDGKRLARPSEALRPLQTAYIFGLKSEYLERFVKELKDSGIASIDSVECAFRPALPQPDGLLHSVHARTPDKGAFRADAIGAAWLSAIGQPAKLSLGLSLTSTRLQLAAVQTRSQQAAPDITRQFKHWLTWLDYDVIHAELLDRRRLDARWNLRFDRAAIHAALASSKYVVLGMPETLAGAAARERAQRLAISVVDQLFGKLYRKRENARSRYQLAPASDALPKTYRKEKRRA